MKICLSMITIDRREVGRKNYLADTLRSLETSGLWHSKTPFEFHLFDSGSKDTDFIPDCYNIQVHKPFTRLRPRENSATAIWYPGDSVNCDWVVFLEDDTAYCNNFLDGAAAFLEKYATEQYRMVTFYTPYREIEWTLGKAPYWNYPIQGFYGTQCVAMRKKDAEAFGLYALDWSHWPDTNKGYDLLMKEWHKVTYPASPYLLASVPCFVQHTGDDSVLNPGRFHTCGAGFPGEQWNALSV